jgi:predicted O-linked N-acetylglucosamine transferase (SPINDLY family)
MNDSTLEDINAGHQAGAFSVNDLIDIALKHQKTGETAKALEIYSEIVASEHTSPRLFNNMGALFYQTGERRQALELFEKALLLNIGYSETWANLEVDAQLVSGLMLTDIARRLKVSNPNNTDCICAEAIGLMYSGQEEEAASIFREALIRNPNSIPVRERLAKCLIALGNFDAATSELMYLLSIDPSNITANLESARLASKLGDANSAISILDSLIKSGSDDIQIRNELGLTYQSKGDLESAIQIYTDILSDHPYCYEIQANLGSCFHELGQEEQALKQYISCVHNQSTPAAIHPAIFFCSAMGIKYIERLSEWSQLYWSLVSAKSSKPHSFKQETSKQNQIKLKDYSVSDFQPQKRIGIVTGDLGIHAVSYFLSSFLMNYDKSRLHVEIISTKHRMDEAAKYLSEYPEKIVPIGSLPDAVATDKILSRNYDIIIETSGFTSGSALHLLVNRCAPIQLHWIGYHASTHMPAMDFFIGDSVITPSSLDSHFSEEVIRLNRAWVAATPFYPIPEAASHSREEIIIGAFSQIQKITNETLELWGSILQKCPHVKLLIKDRLVSNAGSRDRILTRLDAFKVDSSRVIFHEQRLNWQEHMMMYNQLDMALDTTPWSAATTAFDALSMGVPLVGLRGETLAGLQSSSALWHLGRHEWIANSSLEYIEKCCNIIENVHAYRKDKRMLQSEVLKSQLFDQQALCKAIEDVLLNRLT